MDKKIKICVSSIIMVDHGRELAPWKFYSLLSGCRFRVASTSKILNQSGSIFVALKRITWLQWVSPINPPCMGYDRIKEVPIESLVNIELGKIRPFTTTLIGRAKCILTFHVFVLNSHSATLNYISNWSRARRTHFGHIFNRFYSLSCTIFGK